jgi:outer membrane protein assembly factor BamE (lipoprotein component of BamABCDE complex)
VKRPRFTLRVLLVIITCAALACWWLIQLPEGCITPQQAMVAKAGMSRSEVLATFGEPIETHRFTFDFRLLWHYRIKSSKWGKTESRLIIKFEPSDEEVEKIWITPDYDTVALDWY